MDEQVHAGKVDIREKIEFVVLGGYVVVFGGVIGIVK